MEQELFSLDDFSIAQKVNPRGTTEKEKVVKVPEFNVKVNFKKLHIAFDTVIANQINLANNSLAHARSKSGVIAIIVVPGNQGVFGKQVANSKGKGTSFKNKVLMQDLVDLNLTSGKYNLEKITTGPATILGEVVENCDWYKLIMVGEPQIIDLTQKEEEDAPINIDTESEEDKSLEDADDDLADNGVSEIEESSENKNF
jgi:hypothetical protein